MGLRQRAEEGNEDHGKRARNNVSLNRRGGESDAKDEKKGDLTKN